MFILRLVTALEKHKVPYAVAGGYAVSLHGAVRGTLDIDLIIPLVENDFINAETAFRSIGLEPRIPVSAKEVYTFRQEYIEKRNLIAWPFSNPGNPAELVDVIIVHDLRKISTVTLQVQGKPISIVSLRDLIAMKQETGREQDLADVQALKRLL